MCSITSCWETRATAVSESEAYSDVGKTLYFDCFSGAAGDMVVGALLDLGLPLKALQDALGSLAIDHGGVSAERVLRAGVAATKFRVRAEAARVSQADGQVHQH